METKNNDATTRAQNMRRGNEMGCVAEPRSGLFDIVKKDDGRAGRIPAACICGRHLTMPGRRALLLAGGDRYPSRSGIAKRDPDQLSARTTGPRRG